MTPDERKMLEDLADRFSRMPAGAKDPEAEEIVRSKIGNRPDALYMMTQTVLIQNLALQRAQQQVQELQRTGQQQAVGGSSWLGGPGTAGYGQSAPPPPQYAAPAPSQYAPQPSFGGGGFLRGAAQTAAGVAAGTLAAEAIGSMFSHPGGGMFGGNEFMGNSGMAPREEIVNNYYDSPGQNSGLGPDARAGIQGDSFVDPGDTGSENDSSNGDLANDTLANDSSGDDGSQLDDSNFDAGDGGFDSGSGDTWT